MPAGTEEETDPDQDDEWTEVLTLSEALAGTAGSSRHSSQGTPTYANHNGPGRFECQQCGRVYRWKGSLSQHIKHECGKEPGFPCRYCSYRGRHRSHLKRHIIFVHPGSPVVI